MARVRYKSMLAADPETGQPRPDLIGQSGQIVIAGTTTPTPITDHNVPALPFADSRLTVGANAFLPTFWVEDGYEEVDWWDGTNRVPLDSNSGTRDAAIAASEASAAALDEVREFIAQRGEVDFPLEQAVGMFLGVDADGSRKWMNPPSGGTGGTTIQGAPSTWPTTFPPSPHAHGPGQLDVPEIMKALLAAPTAQAARDVLGAGTGNGTSNLALGNTGSTAAPGNHAHAASAVGTAAIVSIAGGAASTVQAALAELAARPSGGGTGTSVDVLYSAGAYPVQAASPPAGVKVRHFYGPVQYTGATWPGVLDTYDYAPLT